jgi:hypothetical protein
MDEDPIGASLLASAELAYQLRVLVSDVIYVHQRGYSADEVGNVLDYAEEHCHRILSELNAVQDHLAVVKAIDRMADVSCGD